VDTRLLCSTDRAKLPVDVAAVGSEEARQPAGRQLACMEASRWLESSCGHSSRVCASAPGSGASGATRHRLLRAVAERGTKRRGAIIHMCYSNSTLSCSPKHQFCATDEVVHRTSGATVPDLGSV
jgi:hypothetical protein